MNDKRRRLARVEIRLEGPPVRVTQEDYRKAQAFLDLAAKAEMYGHPGLIVSPMRAEDLSPEEVKELAGLTLQGLAKKYHEAKRREAAS